MRTNNRAANEIRPLSFECDFLGQAPGRVLVKMGRTAVLCSCSVDATVPPFLVDTGKGWLTSEYNMLPGSTNKRKPRERAGKIDGRSIEIQRLIGRSLRTVVNLNKLGERTLIMDCDVLEADGGTRTASINGAFVALIDALVAQGDDLSSIRQIVKDSVAAVSVGLVSPKAMDDSSKATQPVELLDLEYREDVAADVDLNLVMTGSGRFVEVQAGGEEATFSEEQLQRLLTLGKQGISQIKSAQREVLGKNWPLD